MMQFAAQGVSSAKKSKIIASESLAAVAMDSEAVSFA
jgi:hypothetical protein